MGNQRYLRIDLNWADTKPALKATQDILGNDNVYFMVAYKALQDSSAFRLWCKANDMNINDYDEIAKDLESYIDDERWGRIIEDSKVFRGVVETVAPSPCFEKDVLIMTDKGYKQIQDIEKGDYVLTHTNEFKKVKTPMKNYTEDILEVRFMGSEHIKVTKEHPFYVKRRIGNQYYKKEGEQTYSSKRKFSEPMWKPAEELSKGDYVGFAINQKSELPKWDGVQNNSCKTKYKLNKIDVSNKDFWWLIGRYIGDGWTHKQQTKEGWVSYYRTIICCNKNNNELKDITDKLDKLWYKYTIVEERTVYKIQISDKELYEYLQQFGRYAHGKRLTNDILNLPVDYLKVFLEGYFSADGHFIEENDLQSFVTTSKELAYGIQHCIHKVYKTPTRLALRKGGETIIEGRKVKTRPSYDIRFKLNARYTVGFYEDGYMWQPFRELRELEYNDYVYNMSVEEDESYTVNNMIVHNCSYLLLDKPISTEIGLIKVGEEMCCCLDGYNCDKYKFLKNDMLKVVVWKLIAETCEMANIKIPTIRELNELLDEKTYKIYELGLTSTLNQADSKFATDLIQKYKPTSVDNMSAFVASIRPGFASLLENFIERRYYSTNVKELDELLQDSYHYLLYQESIMKYLNWLGIEESETYDIIKLIAKKKFKEHELIELKDKLLKGWIKRIGNKDGFDETWQVVEDASRYS